LKKILHHCFFGWQHCTVVVDVVDVVVGLTVEDVSSNFFLANSFNKAEILISSTG
jgi:hypothetical protein